MTGFAVLDLRFIHVTTIKRFSSSGVLHLFSPDITSTNVMSTFLFCIQSAIHVSHSKPRQTSRTGRFVILTLVPF